MQHGGGWCTSQRQWKPVYDGQDAVCLVLGRKHHDRQAASPAAMGTVGARKMGRSFLRPMIIVGRIIIQQPAAAAALWF
jgi:hypothetical protein